MNHSTGVIAWRGFSRQSLLFSATWILTLSSSHVVQPRQWKSSWEDEEGGDLSALDSTGFLGTERRENEYEKPNIIPHRALLGAWLLPEGKALPTASTPCIRNNFWRCCEWILCKGDIYPLLRSPLWNKAWFSLHFCGGDRRYWLMGWVSPCTVYIQRLLASCFSHLEVKLLFSVSCLAPLYSQQSTFRGSSLHPVVCLERLLYLLTAGSRQLA